MIESESYLVMSDSLQPHGLSMEFSRLGYWSANPGIEPRSPTLQVDSLPGEPQGKPFSIAINFKADHVLGFMDLKNREEHLGHFWEHSFVRLSSTPIKLPPTGHENGSCSLTWPLHYWHFLEFFVIINVPDVK